MTKTISSIPDFLDAGVEQFRRHQHLQSWSQAAIVLLALGLNAVHVEDGGAYFGGSPDAESELFRHYDESEFDGSFIEWLTSELVKPWGGRR